MGTGTSPFDALLKTFGEAVADTREKLVEEAWFGRTTAAPDERDGHLHAAVGADAGPPATTLEDFKAGYWQGVDEHQRAAGARPLSFDEMAALYAKGPGIAPDPEIDRER